MAGTLQAGDPTAKVLASSAARCRGATPRVIMVTAPKNEAPKPKPVTTAVANSSATEPTSTEVTVPATPTEKITAPVSSADSGATDRMASEPSTPVPLSARISRLPTTWLSMPNTPATSDGPSEA